MITTFTTIGLAICTLLVGPAPDFDECEIALYRQASAQAPYAYAGVSPDPTPAFGFECIIWGRYKLERESYPTTLCWDPSQITYEIELAMFRRVK